MTPTPEQIAAVAAVLAESIHDAMCDISHHDPPPARCSRWAKYPQVALFVAPRLLAAPPDGTLLHAHAGQPCDPSEAAAIRQFAQEAVTDALTDVLAHRACPPEYPGMALVPVANLNRLATALAGAEP